jgi:hypothetical protein
LPPRPFSPNATPTGAIRHWIAAALAAFVLAFLGGGSGPVAFADGTIVQVDGGAALLPVARPHSLGRVAVLPSLRVRPAPSGGGSPDTPAVLAAVLPGPFHLPATTLPAPAFSGVRPGNPAASGHLTRRMPGGPPHA